MPHRISVRNASVDDVDAIHTLLSPFAETHIILPRTRDDLFQHLQEFLVGMYDGELVGVAAVHIYGSNLAEIRSLVVRPDMQRHGLGKVLIEGCEKWAMQLGVARIFALTYVPGFFGKLGYPRGQRESLPHTVWTVCVHCAKLSDCAEVAVEKRLSDALIEPMPIIEIQQS